ncbi:MAG: aminoglycoside phosphotransferase family protein [Clostridiales bacterium]|jgi:hypothetical protein|nr:aminoglycoside phosphotransferase family protein [Clostridiales bacterium]HOL61621.1 aminoglycoside phosphotransferase family protein [Clostridia bacterium]
MDEKLAKVLKGFRIEGSPVSCDRYGRGHINDTYLARTDSGAGYILQRINHRIFKDVPALMRNIAGVTAYINAKLTDSGKEALKLIPTADGQNYLHTDDGEYYRLYNFINAVSIDIPSSPRLMYLCGKGYGNFQKLLDGYPADSLSESIPRFHDTNDRFKKFVAALKADPMGRVKEVSAEIDFFLSRKGYCKKITSLIASGDMPLRVTHNDTKLNNVLIDLGRDEFAAVIDLDTVMPGSIVYDFGDGIRSGANTGAEDERDLSLVNFNMEMYKAYTRGFMEEVAPVLAPSEIENMAFGALLMTFECGMRFLTDHIEGDKYFRIHREGHNLDRARTQIKMVTEMENKINDMNEIVRYYAVENQNSRIHQD